MRKSIASILIISVIFHFYSCHRNSGNAEVMKPEKMEAVLWDYFRIQTYSQEIVSKERDYNDTLVFLKLRDSLFHLHKINQQIFETSMNYYRAHPDQFRPILDSITAFQSRNMLINNFDDNVPNQEKKEELLQEFEPASKNGLKKPRLVLPK
jgi:hypothetical protein